MLDQHRAPIYDALLRYRDARVVPFDVPGHKHGKGNPELTEFLGKTCLSVDVNSMKPLDNLCHPTSVIKEAEELAAEAFGAAYCFFMVGGTTSSVQSMVLSVCKAGEKIIMPRNVHRSAINALILSGAIPVYVNPGVNEKLGIPLGMSVKDVEKAIIENPDAKAVFVNNPTYYGICSDLKRITELAHSHGMAVIVDEAHGTHLYFGENLPISAIEKDCTFENNFPLIVAPKLLAIREAITATTIADTKLPNAHKSIFPPAFNISAISLPGVFTNNVISDI